MPDASVATNACGTCRMCCKLLGVEEIGKPIGTMCRHACSAGCSIYASRPEACVAYECLWLQSQASPTPLPLAVRPDNLGIIFDTLVKDPDTVIARLRPEEANRINSPAARRIISTILQLKKYIVVTAGAKREVIVRDAKDLEQKFTDHGEEIKGRIWR